MRMNRLKAQHLMLHVLLKGIGGCMNELIHASSGEGDFSVPPPPQEPLFMKPKRLETEFHRHKLVGHRVEGSSETALDTEFSAGSL